MILTLIGALALYIIGFLLGRKYERDAILDGVYGVLSQVDKEDLQVDSVTYYYSKEAYEKEVQRLKDLGEDYIEGDYDE